VKTRAVIEVVIVFAVTLLCVALVALSPLGAWERGVTNRPWIEYVVMITVPLLILLITRRDLASYGLSLHPLRHHLDIAATAFLPVAIGSVPLAVVDYRHWSGALVLAAVKIAVLLAVGWVLRRKATRNESGVVAGGFMLLALSSLAPKASVGNALSALLFYVFFLGVGEELLFRGYIQSRLNAAFGRPFRFFGVSWGWGLILTCVLFAGMHVIDITGFVRGDWQPQWWWGLWTFFGGFVGGFVREKTGSIAAPAILHGLPQGIAYAFLGM
jgi:CAAX protease family protein